MDGNNKYIYTNETEPKTRVTLEGGQYINANYIHPVDVRKI